MDNKVRATGTLLTNHYPISIDLPDPPAPASKSAKKGKSSKGKNNNPGSAAGTVAWGNYTLYKYTFTCERVNAVDKKGSHEANQGFIGDQKEAESKVEPSQSSVVVIKTATPTSSPSPKGLTHKGPSPSPGTLPSSSPPPSPISSTEQAQESQSNGDRGVSSRVWRRLIYLLIKQISLHPEMAEINVASDYHSFLVTCKPLPQDILNPEHTVVLYGDHEHLILGYPSYRFKINDSHTELKLREIQKSLRDGQPQTEVEEGQKTTQEQAKSCLNAIFTNAASVRTFADIDPDKTMEVTRAGSKKFFLLGKYGTDDQVRSSGPWDMTVENGLDLQARLGFFLSTRMPRGRETGQLLLNVNTTTSAFYPSGNLDAYLDRLMANGLSYTKILNLLKGVRVRTTYMRPLGGNERVHIIYQLEAPTNHRDPTAGNIIFPIKHRVSDTTATVGNHSISTTVFQYFDEQYPRTQVRKDWRVVSLGTAKDKLIHIPTKLLEIMPGQLYARKTDMVDKAARKPTENRRLIESEGRSLFALGLNQQPENNPSNLFGGLTIKPEMIRVNASILHAPNIVYLPQATSQKNVFLSSQEASAGKWNLKEKKFFRGAKGGLWTILEIVEQDKGAAKESLLHGFFNGLKEELPKYGVLCDAYPGDSTTPDLNRHRLDLDWKNMPETAETTFQDHLTEMQTVINAEPARQGKKNDLKLVFVLLPEKNIPLYAMVKRVCEQKLGLQTVCHVCTKGQDGYGPSADRQLLGNIALKVNLKMDRNSVNQALVDDLKQPLLLRNRTKTMLMGMDVTHAGAGALAGAPSIAAVVGSINDEFSQFPAILRLNPRQRRGNGGEGLISKDQEGKDNKGEGRVSHDEEGSRTEAAVNDQGGSDTKAKGGSVAQGKDYVKPGDKDKPTEQIMELESMVKESVKLWMDNHKGARPERLIVFRDGLSEEQLNTCREKEIVQIDAALEALKNSSKDKKTELLLICTVKRHHTRFFGDDRAGSLGQDVLFQKRFNPKTKSSYNINNPVAGTLVEDTVTLDDRQYVGDFFLISHDILGQGTARPTHYVILRNDMKRDKRDVAFMTHSLCYLFGRSTTSVGLAPPSYYADLAADRARHYVRNVYAPVEHGQYDPNKAEHKMDLSVHQNVAKTMFYI